MGLELPSRGTSKQGGECGVRLASQSPLEFSPRSRYQFINAFLVESCSKLPVRNVPMGLAGRPQGQTTQSCDEQISDTEWEHTQVPKEPPTDDPCWLGTADSHRSQ